MMLTSENPTDIALIIKEFLASNERQDKQSLALQTQLSSMQRQLDTIQISQTTSQAEQAKFNADMTTKFTRLEDKVGQMELKVTSQAEFARGAETSRTQTKAELQPSMNWFFTAILMLVGAVVTYLLTASRQPAH